MQNRDFGTELRDIGRRLEDERLSHSDSVMVAPVGVTDLREPEFLQAQVYWHECRKEKSMPARADLDPMRMHRILSKVLLIDVLGAAPFFRFRVVGTQIADWAHFDASGRTLDQIEAPGYRQMLMATYGEVRGARRPIAHRIRWDEPNGAHRYKRLLLPLADDGENVNMILSCSVIERFEDAEAYWRSPGPGAVRY
ncbi:MAG: PAS domain-containing protein [Rhodospirillales bacterium]